MNQTARIFLLLYLCTFAVLWGEDKQPPSPVLEESWLLKSLVGNKGKFILNDQEGYRVWGCSAVYDDDGKVHLYFAIIPDGGSWLTNGEIGHAVADHPEGPYKVVGSILQGRGEGYWDASSIHNPSIYRVADKWVLLYIGNDISKADHNWDRAPEAGTQRIGMAIADNPYGPWKRFDEPILDVSHNAGDWDDYCVVNPAFIQHPNGQFWLYYRAWDRNSDDRRKTGVAFAENIEGPYKKYEGNPIIDHFEGVNGQTEDPYFFHWKGKFHCVIRDMGNWDWLSSLYLTSDDGLNWSYPKRAKHKGSTYYDIPDDKRCERDQILFDAEGNPDYIFNAVQRTGKNCGGVMKIHFSRVCEH